MSQSFDRDVVLAATAHDIRASRCSRHSPTKSVRAFHKIAQYRMRQRMVPSTPLSLANASWLAALSTSITT